MEAACKGCGADVVHLHHDSVGLGQLEGPTVLGDSGDRSERRGLGGVGVGWKRGVHVHVVLVRVWSISLCSSSEGVVYKPLYLTLCGYDKGLGTNQVHGGRMVSHRQQCTPKHE